jgi:hypothetical protein
LPDGRRVRETNHHSYATEHTSGSRRCSLGKAPWRHPPTSGPPLIFLSTRNKRFIYIE